MNNKIKFLFGIGFYHLVISASEAWRPFEIEVTNISAYSLVDYIEVNSSVSSTTGAMSLFINLLKNVPTYYAKVEITLESSNGNYDLSLINRTIDACEFFRNRKYEPIVQVFYRALTKSGTFPHKCPLAKKLYYVKGVLIDAENFPPVMPSKGTISEVTLMLKSGKTFQIVGGFKITAKIKQV